MPSPIGHAIAGVAVAWAGDRRLAPVCAGLAALPDADLLLPGFHRTYTHSVTAVLVVTIVAAAVTGKVTRWRTALVCGAAYASHLLLDWLGADSHPPFGIQLLWPFSDRWFISGWDVFRETARQHFFEPAIVHQNALAVAQELTILLPLAALVWLVRVKPAA
jgi:inner membrane protein